MLHRVLALVLTAAVTGTPLLLALCQVECADAESSRDRPAHHSCHESSEPAAVTLTAVPHACGHADDAPAGLERAPQTVAAPAAVVTSAAWDPAPPVFVAFDRTAPVDTSPPQTARPTQLRV